MRPVRNQGQCGSCWAYASAASIESLLSIAMVNTVELSTQNLVDCNLKNNGCNGGFASKCKKLYEKHFKLKIIVEIFKAYEYIIENGIYKDNDYPYVASQVNIYKLKKVLFKISINIFLVKSVRKKT